MEPGYPWNPPHPEHHRKVEAKGIKCAATEVTSLPLQTVPIERKSLQEVTRLIELLEEHDDVKEIHSNAEFPDGEG